MILPAEAESRNTVAFGYRVHRRTSSFAKESTVMSGKRRASGIQMNGNVLCEQATVMAA